MRGERTGMRYQLTDRVTVQVSRVDLDARKIDLRLVTEPGIRTVLKNEARRADTEHQSRTQKTEQKGAKKTAAKTSDTGAAPAKKARVKRAPATPNKQRAPAVKPSKKKR